MIHWALYRSSHQRCSVRKGDFRNFTKFTGKHLCHSLFFDKVAGRPACNFIKKRLWHRCFPMNFVEFLRTPFFTEHLWATTSNYIFSIMPFLLVKSHLCFVIILMFHLINGKLCHNKNLTPIIVKNIIKICVFKIILYISHGKRTVSWQTMKINFLLRKIFRTNLNEAN